MPGNGRERLPLGVWAIAAAVVVVTMTVAGRYGFHRDEYYFVVTGRHPAWAAPDNPMLVPYLAAGWYRMVGGNLWWFRLLPALAAAGYAVVGALTVREFSRRPAHLVAAAGATAATGIVLPLGHMFETTTFDALVSATAIWLTIRALRVPGQWSRWVPVGLAAGIAMEIKVMVALVLGCCLLGMLACGPRRVLATAGPWVAAAIATVLAAPNLIWQAVHGFPQATVAASIAAGESASSTPRALLLPVSVLEIGPILVIVMVIGVVRLLRAPRRAEDGWLAVGFLLFLVLMLVAGGKAYYPAAFYPALMAAGAPVVIDWIASNTWRKVLCGTLVSVSLASNAPLTLPLFPIGSPGFRIGMLVNPDMGETVGWDSYVDTVVRVVRNQDVVVLARNYGEAAALTLARDEGRDLPSIYSGHNAFRDWGPPSETVSTAVVVGRFDPTLLARMFGHCTVVAHLTSPLGVDNEENGAPVGQCRDRLQPWAQLWSQLP